MSKSPTYDLVTLGSRGAVSHRVALGQKIAAGGAGTVYETQGDPSTVIKIYHDSISTKDLVNSQCQIQAMIGDPPDLPPFQYKGRAYVQIAWPTALLMKDGKFAGFSMPVLEMKRTKVLEWLLLDKQAMKAGLRCDMGTRVTVARQLAGVVAALHKKGHYVVDMKPVNLSYYPDTLYMAVLDCDGFNIHDESNGASYPAPMFTAEYLAPEFQILGANPNTDPKAQDKFALAVIIFQLLSHGVHPYSGVLSDRRLSSEMKDRISRGDFPYGRQPNPNCAPIPASTYRCLPDELIACFERAFEQDPARRPSAQEWTTRLDKYATPSTNNLVPCKINPKHRHFAGLPCSRCMLDRLSSGQASALASHQSTPQRASSASSAPPAIPQPPSVSPAQWRSTPLTATRPQPSARATAPVQRKRVSGGLLVILVIVLARVFFSWVDNDAGTPDNGSGSSDAVSAPAVSGTERAAHTDGPIHPTGALASSPKFDSDAVVNELPLPIGSDGKRLTNMLDGSPIKRTFVFASQSYEQGGNTVRMAIVSTPEDGTCHGCTNTLGLALFSRTNKGWTLINWRPHMATFGTAMDGYDRVSEIALGKQINGVLIEQSDGGMGQLNTGAIVLAPEDESMHVVWEGLLSDSYASSDGGTTGYPSYKWSGQLSVVKDPSSNWYSLELVNKGTREDDATSTIVSANAVTRYNFNGNIYKPAPSEVTNTQPIEAGVPQDSNNSHPAAVDKGEQSGAVSGAPPQSSVAMQSQSGSSQITDRVLTVASGLVTKGQEAFASQDYSTAIADAEAALSVHPGDAGAKTLLSQAQAAQQQAMNSISIH